ncbi:MAG: carbohydrate ABC transporter permease [Chloroflexota bacterium]
MIADLRRNLPTGILLVVLIAGAIITLVPYVWMVSSSLKLEKDVFTAGVSIFPSEPTLQAYEKALQKTQVAKYLTNSMIVSLGETFLVCATSVLAGYAFARLRFPGRDLIFLIVLGTMMIPTQVTMIPSFILIKWLGWVDTFQGLIIPRAVMAFGIFLMRQFFMTIPYELEEAGRIDGCNRPRLLFQIMLPLTGPALATLAIFSFTNAWNEFFWPLIVTTSEDVKTIQVALATMRGGEVVEWTTLMATVTLSALPTLVVYLLLQRYFTKGIIMSGIKG